MAETPTAREYWIWRVSYSSVTFVFNLGLIIWLLGWGNGTNPLHQAGIGWAFAMNLAVLAGFGAAALLPEILAAMKKPA